jgi:hypothetical protein
MRSTLRIMPEFRFTVPWTKIWEQKTWEQKSEEGCLEVEVQHST